METQNTGFDAFNFDTMKDAVGIDPFAKASNKYAKDERFYMLSKDKDGNGAALIRFLPDSEKRMILPMFKVNTTIFKNGKKRFVNEYSPATIGKPDPFQEKWQELWNADLKEDAKVFSRAQRYVANIKILNDPAHPENNGKIFLYDFSGAINAKLEKALTPSDTDKALGKTAQQLFNPLMGNSFRLVAQKGANSQINYDASEVVPEANGIYASVEEAITDIKENTHKISGLLEEDFYMTYAELQDKMKWVTWTDNDTPAVAAVVPETVVTPVVPVQAVAPVQATQAVTQESVTVAPTPVTPVVPEVVPEVAVTPTPAPVAANTNLDDLLNGLV